MVPDADIRALCRRLDHDQDGEVSFSDFFGSLLPYFIYGNLKSSSQRNPLAVQASKRDTLRNKLNEIQIKTKSPLVTQERLKVRAKSAKLGRTSVQRGFFGRHQDLLVYDEGKKYEFGAQDEGAQPFVNLRKKSPDNRSGSAPRRDRSES